MVKYGTSLNVYFTKRDHLVVDTQGINFTSL